jgi:hypothetical protein
MVDKAPLSTKGWSFQERYLAGRTLHFCDGFVLFECDTLIASEYNESTQEHTADPRVRSDGKLHSPSDVAAVEARAAAMLKASARTGVRGSFDFLWRFKGETLAEKIEFHSRWFDMVERYSIRRLTFDADKAMAIAGVAYFVEQNTGLKYAAGLWKEVLPFNLLWNASSNTDLRPVRSVPTWSWTSVDGRISHALMLPESSRSDLLTSPSKGNFRNWWTEVRPLIAEESLLDEQSVNGQVHNATLSLRGNLNTVFARDVNVYFDISNHRPFEELYCLPILSVKNALGYPKLSQVHGIVLQTKADVGNRFERVGCFCTSAKAVIEQVSTSQYPKSVIYIV